MLRWLAVSPAVRQQIRFFIPNNQRAVRSVFAVKADDVLACVEAAELCTVSCDGCFVMRQVHKAQLQLPVQFM